jgi:RNA 2',3'-cyclic 3'-phosphodiesterase
MRLFIALELSEEQRRELRQFQALFKSQFAGVRWTKPESMHLTLKFIGEADQAGVDCITTVMNNIAQSEMPFDTVYSGCGVFPAPGNARILWIGLSRGAEETITIAQKLDSILSGKGFIKEKQLFKPHLTLGRVRQYLEEKLVNDYLKSGEEFQTSIANVNSLTLFKSDLTKHGAFHTAVYRISFS